MQKKQAAHGGVLCANLFFAANFSLVKLVSPKAIPAFGLNGLRVGGCLILFWAFWALGKTPAGIQRKHWGRFAACALTGVAVNQMLFIKGLTLTSTVHASLLMLCTPLLITLAAWWALKEQLSRNKVAGLFLGVAGAVLLIASRAQSVYAPDPLLGDGLILINAISYSLYFILVRPLMQVYPAVHVIRWVFTLGFFMVLPFAWPDVAATSFTTISVTHWLIILAIVITGTFLAYYFNAVGIQVLGPAVTGAYIYTQPVFAVIIAALVFNEGLTVQKMVAAALIFTGVYLATTATKQGVPPNPRVG